MTWNEVRWRSQTAAVDNFSNQQIRDTNGCITEHQDDTVQYRVLLSVRIGYTVPVQRTGTCSGGQYKTETDASLSFVAETEQLSLSNLSGLSRRRPCSFLFRSRSELPAVSPSTRYPTCTPLYLLLPSSNLRHSSLPRAHHLPLLSFHTHLRRHSSLSTHISWSLISGLSLPYPAECSPSSFPLLKDHTSFLWLPPS